MLGKAAGVDGVTACSFLCTDQLQIAREAFSEGSEVMIACGQEADFFAEIADEMGAADRLRTVDIRDRAGWTDDDNALPKQAALLAELQIPRPQTPSRDITSQGICLILGSNDSAMEAAKRLSEALTITCLLTSAPEFVRPVNSYDLAIGTIVKAEGTIGRFEVTVDQYAPMQRTGRGDPGFMEPKDGAKSRCDIILDLTGNTPLFPAPEKRDGYFHADPKNKLSVERAIFDASQMVGTFEKPIYIRFDASICAHSRAAQTGCQRCLNVCPTGAISPAGDVVFIDNNICAGCGACAAVCPSGAASYDDPPVDYVFRRLRALSVAFREAGGVSPRVLFHEEEHGAEMIRLSARFGRGLPADVIPVEVSSVEGVGHAARAILEGGGHNPDCLRLLRLETPDDLEDILYDRPIEPILVEPILPLGGRRDVTRLASIALLPDLDAPIELPAGAPYGAVLIDQDKCTLCLSCISLCPVGALTDNADRPAVNFQESACLQCGICKSTCPEDAITLKPQLNLAKQAIIAQVLHEEEPFACIECGKPFGVKSTISKVIEKLEGKHWMYTNSDNSKLIQMCDDCRVKAQYHGENTPFHAGERPRMRTTDDYLSGDLDDKE